MSSHRKLTSCSLARKSSDPSTSYCMRRKNIIFNEQGTLRDLEGSFSSSPHYSSFSSPSAPAQPGCWDAVGDDGGECDCACFPSHYLVGLRRRNFWGGSWNEQVCAPLAKLLSLLPYSALIFTKQPWQCVRLWDWEVLKITKQVSMAKQRVKIGCLRSWSNCYAKSALQVGPGSPLLLQLISGW